MRALLALLLLLALASPAVASPTQESWFQDDDLLIHAPPDRVRATLDELRALGVDRLRVTVLWRAIAPAAPPANPTDPAAYANWAPYDTLVQEAGARGLQVNFNVTGPGPPWAHPSAPRPDVADTFEPDAAAFGQFVQAVGARYAGVYRPFDYGDPLPRVGSWAIWNEPNHSGWLTPQWRDAGGGRMVPRAPALYRSLLDAAWAGLAASGHGRDSILIGETAPKGVASRGVKRFLKPLEFIRGLYCVDRRLRVLRGAAAARMGCPRSGFAAAHPALFAASGYAHHPYNLLEPPAARPRDRDFVTIGSLGRLTTALDRILRRYGRSRRLPVHLTEFGYQTQPDPFGVPLARQAAYLNQSEYIAWRNPRVRSVAQFLLHDSGEPVSLTFQSGLVTAGGRRKPAYAAYRLPVFVSARGRVWAHVRTARSAVPAAIEFRRAGATSYRVLRRVRTTARGFLSAAVRVPGRGTLRVSAAGVRSRAVRVRPR